MDKRKVIIVGTVLLDVIGLGIVIPTLPLYVEKFGATEFMATAFFAFYAAASFLATPLLGSLSDKYGRRPVLILSLLGTSIGWFIFAFAPSLLFLIIGRMIDGFTAGNFSTAQSYLVDLAKDDKERTSNMGLIGAAFGIGFLIGPGIGAALSHVSANAPFILSGVLALLNTLAALKWLPESLAVEKRATHISLHPFAPLGKAIRDRSLRLLYVAWFCFSLAFVMFTSVFSLFTSRMFGWDAKVNGWMFVGIGIVGLINQGFLLRKFWLKKFKEPQLELFSLIAMAVAYILASFVPVILFIVMMLLNSFAQGIVRAVTNSQIVARADQARRGEVVGVTASVMSAASVIGPLIAGTLFEMSPAFPWYGAAVAVLVAIAVVITHRKKFSVVADPKIEPIVA